MIISSATLFDLKPYHQELPPDPNAPLTAKEMIECLAEAEQAIDKRDRVDSLDQAS